MIQKAKVYFREIPFFEILNSTFDFGYSLNTLSRESLLFHKERDIDFPNYINYINEPINALHFEREAGLLKFGDSNTVRITSFSKEENGLKVGYIPSKYSVYKGFAKLKGLSEADAGFINGIVGDRILANHCGAGIFINCRRGGIGKDANDRVLIGMRPNSEVIDTHRLFRTYSASGSSDLEDLSPFETIKREAEEEINFSLDIDKTELISFGYDSQLGYFQFSFYHQSEKEFGEIAGKAKYARDVFEYNSLDLITYSEKKLERAIEEIAETPWEPSALYSLILLYSRLILNDCRDIREYEERFANFRKDLEEEIIKKNDENHFKIFI